MKSYLRVKLVSFCSEVDGPLLLIKHKVWSEVWLYVTVFEERWTKADFSAAQQGLVVDVTVTN